VTDVICCQQKSVSAIHIFAPEHANTRDAAKQQFHQQRCGAIGELAKVRAHPVTIARIGFNLQYLIVSLLGAIGGLFLRLIPFFNVVS